MEKQADKQKGKQANRQTQGKKDKQKQSEKANSSLSAALPPISKRNPKRMQIRERRKKPMHRLLRGL